MDIYQELIMDHARHPRNAGRMVRATLKTKAMNPFCGDEADIFLKIEKEKIHDIKFEIEGCILSKAALSIFSEDVKGKSIKRVITFKDSDMFKLIGFTPSLSRLKCALFGFEAVRDLARNHKIK
ncbi:iron-sulfur cluster assembly scaffold protein [Patescibacteria group bacterium]|nr:iron-sulfur cluster assembly scaffold protein [Patescibacteria group bacterium]